MGELQEHLISLIAHYDPSWILRCEKKKVQLLWSISAALWNFSDTYVESLLGLLTEDSPIYRDKLVRTCL